MSAAAPSTVPTHPRRAIRRAGSREPQQCLMPGTNWGIMADGLQVATHAASASLAVRTEARRVAETADRSAAQRSALGQFFTPAPIASLLAGMFDPPEGPVRVLDPGAGVGSLTAALVDRAVVEGWTVDLDVTAVEVDRGLLEALTETLRECAQAAPSITARTVPADFVEWACRKLDGGLFAPHDVGFDLAILNPPYQKLATSSALRRILSRTGIEVTNLYAARRVPDPARRTSKRSRCPSRTSYVPTIRTHSSASSRGIQPSQPQRE